MDRPSSRNNGYFRRRQDWSADKWFLPHSWNRQNSCVDLSVPDMFYVPHLISTVRFEMNPSLSRVKNPRPEDFIVRSLWNNTHI